MTIDVTNKNCSSYGKTLETDQRFAIKKWRFETEKTEKTRFWSFRNCDLRRFCKVSIRSTTKSSAGTAGDSARNSSRSTTPSRNIFPRRTPASVCLRRQKSRLRPRFATPGNRVTECSATCRKSMRSARMARTSSGISSTDTTKPSVACCSPPDSASVVRGDRAGC